MSSVKNKKYKKKKNKKLTFSTTETKYLCLLHILLHLYCHVCTLCYIMFVYPRGINAFWNFQINFCSVLFTSRLQSEG